MENGNFNYIRRAIKRTYKWYTGERDDGKASIADVAKFFDIKLDKERLDDYSIRRFGFDIPSIEIVDSKTGTVYKAQYTNGAKLLNSYSGPISYVRVVVESAFSTTESLYHIPYRGTENRHIATKITLRKDYKELSFTCEDSHNIGFHVTNGQKFVVEFNEVVEKESREVRQRLFTKKYNRFYDGTLEHFFTYDLNHYIVYDDEIDVYSFARPNGVSYGLHEMTIRNRDRKKRPNWKIYLEGFCFENLNVHNHERFPLPYNMDLLNKEKCPELYDHKTRSMVYFVGTDSRKDRYYEIKIFKDTNGIHIKYDVLNIESRKRRVYEELLPVLSPGNISIDEIDSIIEFLDYRYGDGEFIIQTSIQLREFRRRICVSKGLSLEEEDPLSPKTFIDMPLSEIEEKVTEDRDAYFDLAQKQFEKSTHLDNVMVDDIKSFRMVPRD